ncbi:hypothetical protein NG796_00060 [Laspinema sp. A4]|uniref:hypothetical protein n=1 Tax=Laspinema sp. D2d TaxID=2953686 RepID=UPI0021BA5915|nr:hypothetical protein [Laspinema sp. D2d]MCT7981677.1 hypothetical protein [Laspinema sp. D2d]
MAKGLSQWQQWVNELWRASPLLKQGFVDKTGSPMRIRLSGTWLFGGTVTIALLIWNWKLLVATGAGVLVMLATYMIQGWNWHQVRSRLNQSLGGANRQVAIAVGTGGLATLGSYMAVSIWLESPSPWLATAAIAQGIMTFATLILLLWQGLNHQVSSEATHLNARVMNLTDSDPLKRLIAVRQITKSLPMTPLAERRAIADYFRLMLSRETESLVRDAVLDGLQAIEPGKQLGVGMEPLAVPPLKKRTPVKVRPRVYEYEE